MKQALMPAIYAAALLEQGLLGSLPKVNPKFSQRSAPSLPSQVKSKKKRKQIAQKQARRITRKGVSK